MLKNLHLKTFITACLLCLLFLSVLEGIRSGTQQGCVLTLLFKVMSQLRLQSGGWSPN